MGRTANILNEQLDLYGNQAEAWKKDHAEANGCLDLEQVIAFGLFVYQRIQFIDHDWAAELIAAGTRPADADARAMENLYARWRDRTALTLELASRFEANGYEVTGARELREAFQAARLLLSIPTDRLLESARQPSKPIPMGELRDELRRRMDVRR